jgi:hypothetical protein
MLKTPVEIFGTAVVRLSSVVSCQSTSFSGSTPDVEAELRNGKEG